MLKTLSVSNLAVVESARIDFGTGLSVITGETGSGKSVLMGALELVLGARADASAVREGAKEARIEALFEGVGSVAGLRDYLVDVGLPSCEEDVLIIRRTISAVGGGRVYVNDASATVQTLRTLGHLLVDIHSPNDHQHLLDERFQRRLVDSYGAIDLKAYASAWSVYEDLCTRRDELLSDSEDVTEEVDRLRFTIEELDAAHLLPEDEDELPARHAAAAYAAEIAEALWRAVNLLSSEGEQCVSSSLHDVVRALRDVARHHVAAVSWLEEAESISECVNDLAHTLADELSRMDANPESLEELDARLTLVSRLKRKYACATVSELLMLRDKRAARLDDLENRAVRLAELTSSIAEARAKIDAAGAVVSAARARSAKRFAAVVARELHVLGFLKAGFEVSLAKCEPDASGCDAVTFLFEPNPGEPARPLADIASTGETARVMLAIKTVSAEHEAVPTLVFDEIDSNVGGETGRAVGEKLRAVARHRQVIAITHLPQSAVYGTCHLAVSKHVSGGRTRTSVACLEGTARVDEIARMLGGASLTSVVTRHAQELLAQAQQDSTA